MLSLLLPLLFRILPHGNIQKINSNKSNKELTTCYKKLENGKYSPQSYPEFLIYCHSGLSDPIFNVISTNTNGAYSSNPNSKIFYIQNVECNIQTCTFQHCIFHTSLINFEGTNNSYNAISNTITNCSNGSGVSSANIMYVNAKNTNIQGNTITYTTTDKSCRSFYILHNTDSILTENIVTNSNTVQDGKGTTVYITGTSNENTVKVTGCTFTNCGKPTFPYYTVYFDVPKFELSLSTITFSNADSSCGCVSSSSRAIELSYISNTFQNSKYTSSDYRSAGIDHEIKSSQEIITIENNTFSGIKGNNQGRCIFMQVSNADNFIFRENTFKENVDGSFFVKFIFNDRINEMVIDSCKFIRNSVNTAHNSVFSSSNQIIIQNKLANDCSLPFTLTLLNCYFEANQSPLDGGGFHYGNNRYASNTIVHIIGCDFISNRATKNGGAIMLQSYQGFLIENYKFVQNTATEKGGAIYLESDEWCHNNKNKSPEEKSEESVIRNCTFEGNSGVDAHCIYAYNVSGTNIQILSSIFTDCGSNHYIIFISENIGKGNIENCTFNFTDHQSSSAAISSNTSDISIIGNRFEKCNGNTIHFRNTQDITNVEIIENYFYYCYRGTIIKCEGSAKIQSHTIQLNTFENVQLSVSSIDLQLSTNANLVLINNTFKSFVMNTDVGGTAIKYGRGGLRVDYYQNNGNTNLKITKCFFEGNTNQKGAGVCINVKSNILIEESVFIGNSGTEGSAIYIKPDYGNSPADTATIRGCKFHNNEATTGSSIYFVSGSSTTVQIESCQFEEDQGGIFIQNLGNKVLSIESTTFTKINTLPSIKITQTTAIQQLTINHCTFDECSSPNNKCFDISTQSTAFTFSDNIIKNCQKSGHNNYCGSINCNNKINTFDFVNISFINNTSNSLYGGGSSIVLLGIGKIAFNACKFTDNKAYQDKSESRPTSSTEPYYNGDGGAIQIGYWCKTNDIDVLFTGCFFTRNKAERHGGAISIQTLKTVEINDCHFENNEANCDFEQTSRSNIKEFENHFHKKIEGRGGAIYINPSYSYSKENLDCPSTSSSLAMTSFTVKLSEFSQNNAHDGYAMYIEGDESNTVFTIETNQFNNNYNDKNYVDSPNDIYGAVITTEIRLNEAKIISDNTYTYTNQQLNVKEIQFVDHYGNTPTGQFTHSFLFSNSQYFTDSKKFTQSRKFSPTEGFSKSNPFSGTKGFTKTGEFSSTVKFTFSNDFSDSKVFSQSKGFSNSKGFSSSIMFSSSNPFTETMAFTATKEFSISNDFSKSNIFSDSDSFSQSKQFSKTKEFSLTKGFTETRDFSNSNLFSKSNAFSQSNIFSKSNDFSQSKGFSQTNQFSKTNAFSLTQGFTKTNDFSNSNLFSETIAFTQSNDFSQSKEFSQTSQFSKTNAFSLTQGFTKTNDFSNSNLFSKSEVFSKSKGFSQSKEFSQSKQFSKTKEFSLTQEFTKTRDFSNSNLFSKSNAFSQSNDFSQSIEFSQSNKFSETNEFSLTQKFTKTNDFSNSNLFSETIAFSQSNDFSKSNDFSQSKEFSQSNKFSETNEFSLTQKFTKTNDFSNSNLFSESKAFSQSNDFSKSKEFSSTTKFSGSILFSNSNPFSLTSAFSKSSIFSTSAFFTKSNEFSQSNMFSHTKGFSLTDSFSKTEKFSLSTDFTKSNKFSFSFDFTFSQKFSESHNFSPTGQFSLTDHFSKTELFSLTSDFSKSVKFSDSTKFTFSNEFTRTIHFTLTDEFSKTTEFTETKKFSESKEFTISNKFTSSFHFSQSKSFSNTEKFSHSTHFTTSNKFSFSDSFSNSRDFSFSMGFSESSQFTISATLIPMDPSCFIETEEGNLTFTDRCDYSEFEGKNLTVQIIRSNFTEFIDEKDGAAVHIINCGIKCNGTKFIDCMSTKGGGGGIYINNTIEHKNDVNLIGLVFLRCKAYYGGAAFIQSNYEMNSILIKNCLFMSNEVYSKRANEDLFFGGSSVFLMADDADLIDNDFTKNKGKGGALKIVDTKTVTNNLVILDENKNSIKIKGCSFEQTNSIFYETKGNGGSEVEINDCNFKGKLVKGNRYIDGNLFEKNSPKIHIKDCKFEEEINESVNVDLIKEFSYVYVIKSDLIKDDNFGSKNFLVNIVLFLALFAISTAVFVIKMKKPNNQNDDLLINNFDEKFGKNISL